MKGYRVTANLSSMKVLEIFKDNPVGFDLIITDQTMPEMTGVQLISEVRRINPTIPVILCTGYSEKVSEESAAGYGISHFLMKPVSGRNLAEKIAEELTKYRRESCVPSITGSVFSKN